MGRSILATSSLRLLWVTSVLPGDEEVIKPPSDFEGAMLVDSDDEVCMESTSLVELGVLHSDCDLSEGEQLRGCRPRC